MLAHLKIQNLEDALAQRVRGSEGQRVIGSERLEMSERSERSERSEKSEMLERSERQEN